VGIVLRLNTKYHITCTAEVTQGFILLEQGALFDGKAVRYLAGRQTEWHIIR